MAKKKGSRRVRHEGKLYTKEELEKLKTTATDDSSEEKKTTKVSTEGAVARKEKKVPQEKIRKDEKDNSPVIIVSYNDSSGKRVTKQFTCDRIEMTENKRKTLQRSGPQTVLDIYIEAQVIDEM